jgi:hypothetical protein
MLPHNNQYLQVHASPINFIFIYDFFINPLLIHAFHNANATYATNPSLNRT